MCATKIAEAVGLDAGSVEDIRTAALLFNMKELGIPNEVLCKAAQVSQEHLQKAMRARSQASNKAGAMGGSPRCDSDFSVGAAVAAKWRKPDDASFEIQVLLLAEEYQALTSGDRGAKMSPAWAGQEVIKRAGSRYDSLVLGGFTAAFGGQAAGAGV